MHILKIPNNGQMTFDSYAELLEWCTENEYSFQDMQPEGGNFIYVLID